MFVESRTWLYLCTAHDAKDRRRVLQQLRFPSCRLGRMCVFRSRSTGTRTQVRIDADTGATTGLDVPTGRSANETITSWIQNLHTATVFHAEMRILITMVGIAIFMLNVTGLLIFLRKRSAGVRSARCALKLLPFDWR